MNDQQFQQMLSYFSIPRKIGTTFSDIQYMDTNAPEDIVNEYRQTKSSEPHPAPQTHSFLSKSTELSRPTSAYIPPYPHRLQSNSLSHSAPLSSINMNNYYSGNHLRRNLPYRTGPHYPDNAYLGQQIPLTTQIPYQGKKLSRSDYYISKPSQYHYHQMAYPLNYVSLNPNQFSNY